MLRGVYNDASSISRVESVCKVDLPEKALQYSTVTVNNTKANYSNSTVNSTVELTKVLDSISDLIINEDYRPYYRSKLKSLGVNRFMELANKARAGSDSPAVLFKWFLKNPNQVR